MKTSKTVPVILALMALAGLGGLTPLAHAPYSISSQWRNATVVGSDPILGSVTAYKEGTTATLSVTITNDIPYPIKVVSAQIGMDWGNNYTASGISNSSPMTISIGGFAYVPISFTVPSPSVASNFVTHASRSPSSEWSFFKYNYTVTMCSNPPACTTTTSTNYQYTSGISFPSIAVYSSDQADAMVAYQQVSALASAGPSIAAIFKTPQASSLLVQSFQQANLGTQLYVRGNFTAAKTDFQNSVSLLNQAISTENSHGNTLESNTMVADYGSLLLGIGAIVGAVGAIIYAIRRPKMLSASATHQTPT